MRRENHVPVVPVPHKNQTDSSTGYRTCASAAGTRRLERVSLDIPFSYLMHAFTCVERHEWAALETERVTSSYILLIVVLGDSQPEWKIVENMTSFQGQNYDLRSSYCTSKKSGFVRFTSISL